MAESGVYLEIFLWNLSGFCEYTLFIFLNDKCNHTFFLGELLQFSAGKDIFLYAVLGYMTLEV